MSDDAAAKKLAEKCFNARRNQGSYFVQSSAVRGGSSCVKIFELAAKKLRQPKLNYVDDAFFDGKLIGTIYDYLIVECGLSKPDASGRKAQF